MKLVTFEMNGAARVGVLNQTEDRVIDVHKAQETMNPNVYFPETMLECIEQEEQFLDQIKPLLEWIDDQTDTRKFMFPNEEVRLLAPIPEPRKNIFCAGRNYDAHAREMGSTGDLPEYPMIFSKTPTTVIGPNGTVLNHQEVTNCLDYEGELAVIIGKGGKGISEEEALNHVFGYTIINDVSARDLVKRHKHYLLGKSLDTSCPMGPCLVHRSMLPDPGNLNIKTKVNGEVRQSANTNQFIFTIPKIIATITQGTTLEPGDIIATGTPAGVGSGFTPPRFLQPGDLVEIEIEGIGVLRNQVER